MPLAKKTSFVLGNFFIYITAIIFISSFFISPTPIYADTTTYIVSSGTDATTGTPTEFTSDDITKLNTSDDESIQSIAATDSISPPAEPPIPPFHTDVVADITENTTWIQKQSPYIVTIPVMVAEGATLTIESGVIVKFNDDSYLIVDGVINALGTSAEPIYFTSYADDSLGGDTNGDGEDSLPSAGDWSGIVIESPTTQSILNHVIFRYSGELFLHNGSVSSDTFDSTQGITAIGSHGSFTNLTIPDITILGESVLNIDTATISNPDDSAVTLYDKSSLTLKNATVKGSSWAVVSVYQNSSAIFDAVNITGNIFSDIAVSVFNNSSLNISKSSMSDIKDGLRIYDNSSVTITDSSITCENTGISVHDDATLNFSKGFVSCGYDGILIYDEVKATIDNVKISNATDAGIAAYYNSNLITITESEITGNEYGFFVYDTNISAHQNNIYNNTSNGVFAFWPLDPNQFDFTSNYWGDPSGPTNTANPTGLGDIVSDDVLFAPFCKNESCIFHNPVIVVPGVMGTEINRTTDSGSEKLWLDLAHNLTDIGDEFMDPLQFNTDLTPSDTSLTIGDVIGKATVTILGFEYKLFDYTASLLEEFQNQGYVEGTDLFLFPYDWRYGVSEDNVKQLKQKIADILIQTGAEKIDVVAHSMGGLLVKKYVVENPEDNNIDKAVFVGVPNTGAPKAIKALIQGDGNLLTADSEMKKISQNIPAAYDLLPSEQYFNIKGSYIKIIDQYILSNKPQDLNFEESNIFVINDHKLNAQALVDANNLHTADFDNYDLRTAGVDLYAINGCKAGTTGKFIESRYHSLFGGDDYVINNFKIEEIPGDGTVPLESATNLPIDEANKYYALKGEHGEMLSSEGIRQKIINIISGSTLSTQDNHNHEIITQDISECKLNGRAISVFSPLSISIVDQDGNHSGLASDGVSIENNIPNADFQIIDEHKFVYLPTDEGQTYTISVAGTGTGIFTITDATIEENNITQTQVFSNISVTSNLLGSISLSNDTNITLSLDTDGDGATDQILEPTSILNASESQDFVPAYPSVNPPKNNSHGGSFRTGVSQNNTTIQPVNDTLVSLPTILAEIPAENSVLQPISSKKIKNTEPIKITPKVENSLKENILTANVIDSKTPISNTIVIVTLAGVIIILLLAKKFIKL